MQVYTYEVTMETKGTLTLKNLPLNVGENVEVIVIPRPTQPKDHSTMYPFWGKSLTYHNPTAPVASDDWEVLS